MLNKNTPELAQWMTLWPELNFIDPFSLKFMPFGFSSEQEPDFFRPCLTKAIQGMNIDDLQYSDQDGNFQVREAFLKYFDSRFHQRNLTVQDNIITSFGANQIIRVAMRTFLENPEDEVILLEPLYPNYLMGLKYVGKLKTFQLKLNPETLRFEFDFECLRNILSERTKLLILINPNNPTGKVPTEAEYQQLTDLLQHFPHVKVVEDAAYCNFLGESTSLKFFREFGDNFHKTVTVFSGGKKFNVTGVRVGWGVGPKPVIDLMKTTLKLDLSTSVVDQRTMAHALEDAAKPYHGANDYWQFSALLNAKKYAFVKDALEPLGIHLSPLEGSYYVALHIEPLVSRVQEKYYYSLENPTLRETWRDRAVCRLLLKEYSVGLLPYSALYITEHRIDTVLRVPLIRTMEQLTTLVKAFQDIMAQPV